VSLAFPLCGAEYVASHAEPRILDKDSARCKHCRRVMIAWPSIGLELVCSPMRRDGA
jgi:hypothetical protein